MFWEFIFVCKEIDGDLFRDGFIEEIKFDFGYEVWVGNL